MWRVSFKFYDLQKQIISSSIDFEEEKDATKFYNHICKTTNEMINKYGNLGVYHPYFNIRVKEIKY